MIFSVVCVCVCVCVCAGRRFSFFTYLLSEASMWQPLLLSSKSLESSGISCPDLVVCLWGVMWEQLDFSHAFCFLDLFCTSAGLLVLQGLLCPLWLLGCSLWASSEPPVLAWIPPHYYFRGKQTACTEVTVYSSLAIYRVKNKIN